MRSQQGKRNQRSRRAVLDLQYFKYPRKVAKKTAWSAWQKAGVEENDGKQDAILTDIDRRLRGEWRGKEIWYIPHPATYLNGCRWEDESEEAAVDRQRTVEPVRRLFAGETVV